jgi:hypothetical protein
MHRRAVRIAVFRGGERPKQGPLPSSLVAPNPPHFVGLSRDEGLAQLSSGRPLTGEVAGIRPGAVGPGG